MVYFSHVHQPISLEVKFLEGWMGGIFLKWCTVEAVAPFFGRAPTAMTGLLLLLSSTPCYQPWPPPLLSSSPPRLPALPSIVAILAPPCTATAAAVPATAVAFLIICFSPWPSWCFRKRAPAVALLVLPVHGLSLRPPAPACPSPCQHHVLPPLHWLVAFYWCFLNHSLTLATPVF